MKVNFYDHVEESLIKYAVVVSLYNGAWVFCKQKTKDTYEVPGGHRELGEDALTAAIWELYEETGAVRFDIKPVCVYSVTSEAGGFYKGEETFGMLYYANISSFVELPDFEMEKVVLFPDLPDNLTYPQIQPELVKKIESYLTYSRKQGA